MGKRAIKRWIRAFAVIAAAASLSAGKIAIGAEDDKDEGDGLPRPVLGKELVDRLLDPATRADAFYDYILESDRADKDSERRWEGIPREIFDRAHTDIEVIPCPAREGSEELIAILYDTDHSALFEHMNADMEGQSKLYPEHAEEVKRRRRWAKATAAGSELASQGAGQIASWKPGDPMVRGPVLMFLDREGKVRWPFGGDNMISRGCLFDLNGDGILERVDYTNWGIAKKHEVQSLEIGTVEMDSRSVLQVVFNWHPDEADDANRWGFAVTDEDGDGLLEIELGPANDDFELLGDADVVFRWNAESKSYVGPVGGQGKHWKVLAMEDGQSPWKKLKAMKGLGYPLRSEPAVPVAGEISQPAPMLEWPQREPYRHGSLVDVDYDDLFRFMWKGKPNAKEEEDRGGSSDWSFVEVPPVAVGLDPREAALTIAEANRTNEHRRRYELLFAVAEGEMPPQSATAVMHSRGGGWTPNVYVDALRHDGNDGELLRCYHQPGHRYPNWRAKQRWYRSVDGPKAKWTMETVWWLGRLRTVSRFDHEVEENHGFGADDIPSYQLVHSTGVNDAGEVVFSEFPTTQGFAAGSRWKGHYDRRVAASLTLGLWNLLFPFDRNSAKKPNEARDRGVVEHLLSADDPLGDWPIPDIVRFAVETAGDRGWRTLGDEIDALHQAIGAEPAAFEGEYRRLETAEETEHQAWRDGDRKAYERMRKAERALFPMESHARVHPGIQLRGAIGLARRQFEASTDREALERWAKDKEAEGAAWALQRLREFDKGEGQAEAILTEQSKVDSDESRWIFPELLKRDRERAIEAWRAMPEPLRLRHTVTFYRALDDGQQRRSEWIDVLVGLIGETGAAEYRGAEAIDLLVPDEEPMRFSEPAVDKAIAACLGTLNESTGADLDYSQKRLRLAAALALARRDGAREHWELLLEAHQRALDDGSGDDGVIRSGLLKIVAQHPQLAQEFWLRLRLKDSHGRWNSFFLDAYAADLRLAKGDLARAATLSPDEREGPRARSWLSTPETLKGGFHAARQVVALWDEPDELTRLKMQIVFGLRAVEDFGYRDAYGAEDQLRQQLAGAAEALDDDQGNELLRWIGWCQEFAPKRIIGQTLSSRQRKWLSEWQALLLK